MCAETVGRRRLGAIMFTDVVGYTSMSSRDERRTLELLREYRKTLESAFPKFEGRVVKTMGDGFLVEFASAVEAVDCAVEVQSMMLELNSRRKTEDRTLVRIGIHVGDIVHSEGDVLGDAVNVASRVEPLAEPGGICVTRQVVDQVEGKVRWRMDSLGNRSLRNVPTPVEVFRVTSEEGPGNSELRHEADRRRVAILPFTNLSPDPSDKYFADGMTEELISTVSRIGELSVISRSSAVKYRDAMVPMSQVGRELDVGAVLEGSVRKAGNKVRIAAQLIEVDTDRYVWSQTYDRDLTDILGVQGEIAQQVAEGLKVHLLSRERERIEAKPTGNPEAYNLYLKGRFYWNERTESGTRRALKYFEEALAADPRFARAYTGVADCYNILSDYGWMPPAKAAELAKASALKALEIDPSLAEAHASLGLVYVNHMWTFAEGEKEYKRALELNPSYVPAYHWYGIMFSFMRRFDDALEMVKRASSLDPFSIVIRQSLGVCLMNLGRFEEAMQVLKKVEAENPDLPSVHYWMSQVNLAQSKFAEAIEEAKREVEADNFDPGARLDLALALSEAGRKKEAAEVLEEVLAKKDDYYSPCSVGMVILSLGREKEGFDWLEKAYEEHDSSLLYFRSLLTHRKYLAYPRWAEIEAKMGFPAKI